MIGIYTIINKQNSKLYVGSSINIPRRFKEHKRNLINNKHCNSHLQYSFNKHGLESFIFEVLDSCDLEFLESTEQYWINMTQCANRKFGYNLDICAYNSSHKLSEETKNKIRIKAIGRKRSKEAIEKTTKANKGQSRPKQSETMKKLYAEGKIKAPMLSFQKYSEMGKISRRNFKAKSVEERAKVYNSSIVEQLDTNGKVIAVYSSYSEAAKATGVDKATVKKRCVTKNFKKAPFLKTREK